MSIYLIAWIAGFVLVYEFTHTLWAAIVAGMGTTWLQWRIDRREAKEGNGN